MEGGTRLKVIFSIADSLTITLVDIRHLLLIIDFSNVPIPSKLVMDEWLSTEPRASLLQKSPNPEVHNFGAQPVQYWDGRILLL